MSALQLRAQTHHVSTAAAARRAGDPRGLLCRSSGPPRGASASSGAGALQSILNTVGLRLWAGSRAAPAPTSRVTMPPPPARTGARCQRRYSAVGPLATRDACYQS